MKVYVNGALVDAAKAKVSVFDRGFLFGDGLFETLFVSRQGLLFWRRHWSRLARSAACLGIELPDESVVIHALEQVFVASGLDEALLRVTLTGGVQDAGMVARPGNKPTLIVTARGAPEVSQREFLKGWSVTIAGTRRGALFDGREMIKATSYLASILAAEYARCVGADEAVILDELGRVTEGSRTNIFAVLNGRLVTPALDSGVLAGVTREVIMEIAGEISSGCVERLLKPRDMLKADEIFMTGTAYGVMPVDSFDGRRVGGGKPGALTCMLAAAYQELVTTRGLEELWI